MKKLLAKYETVRIKIRRIFIKKTSKYRKKKIKDDDFTIISNNCWGGFIYQSYGIQYKTPTIGCFFMAKDYIKFISDIKFYLDMPLEFIEKEQSKYTEFLNQNMLGKNYPIGILGDIEIHFLHFHNEQEALEKWNERKARINFDKILYKFSEMNECTEEEIIAFQKLELKNKVCFISEKYKNLKNDYTVVKKNITASREPFGKSKKININKIINGL